jgi:hypothetical protein
MNWPATKEWNPAAVREQSSPWAVDEFVECYACWREESAAVRSAYEHWQSVEPHDQSLAFAAYVAALDREEHAARDYGACAERIAPITS